MPYVLRHKETGEIAAAVLRNIYDIDYWGARWWAAPDEAETAAAGNPDWAVLQVTDSRLKLMNVKLNNDPNRRLYLDEQGSIRVETGSAR
ncbi:hypothetical protein [Paenibacillus thermotolerans]|uniref:hypothetical protein n=1 Tax=Paenibacillus thermotolerans TaxID=3027807 RepID=UPI00236874EA|nr:MULTISPECIES: hypothetical protein [unclassified Paenibacillus]